jgi:ribosomal protein RSM22 (predicted rRNA methylase)
VKLPGELNAAIAAWLSTNGQGSLSTSSRNLSDAYRQGKSSSHVNLAAYVATRVPATFAANTAAHTALAAALPGFAPTTVLDMGAGPGVATWAAVAAWPTLKNAKQCEQDKNFAGLAASLQSASEVTVLREAAIILKSEASLPPELMADLVVASYVLAELPLESMAQVAARLWARTTHVLLLLEPGTPQGFARLRKVRDALLGQGAHVLAPCTHQNKCPMAVDDWCHFKARVQRSREHMHAKQATVPFEDEAYSYLVLARAAPSPHARRIIAPVTVNKVAATLRLCGPKGLAEEVIASRDKPTYKQAKKAQWGDLWE